MNFSKNTISKHPIITILVFASVLRFWGIWHGYPFSYYPDEQHFVNRAIAFGSGDLNPHWFHKPAFLMYLLFFEYGLFFLFGKIIGLFPNVDAFATYYFTNTWPFILMGRITVTIFGIATVYMTYKIAEKFWSKRVGIYSAIFLALCYGHIFSGQDIKADVPTTFFTMISVYYMLKVVKDDFSKKDYMLAGLFAGLGTATKYYSIALLPCLLLVSLYESFKNKKASLLLKYLYSFLSFWAIYFVVSPYNFMDPLGRRWAFEKTIRLWNKISPWHLNIFPPLEGKEAAQFLAENYEGHYIVKSIANYFNVLFSTEGAGIVIGAIFVASVLLLLWKPSFKKIILLSFPALFTAISIVTNPSYTEVRHQLIIYPFLSIAGGIVVINLSDSLKKQRSIINLFLIILLLMPFMSIVKNNIYISKTDTRTLAKHWIEANIPPGSKILLDKDTPKLQSSAMNLSEHLQKARKHGEGPFTTHLEKYYEYQIMAATGITYDITHINHQWWHGKEETSGVYYSETEFDHDMGNPVKLLGIMPYEFYKEYGYEYVITSSEKYLNYQENSPKAKNFPSFYRFYQGLFNKGILIKEFKPDPWKRPGPVIKIFKIN